jgi:hypothetical protein
VSIFLAFSVFVWLYIHLCSLNKFKNLASPRFKL